MDSLGRDQTAFLQRIGALRVSTVQVLLLLTMVELATSQETTGSLQGRVLTTEGHPLASVQVVATGPSLLGVRSGSSSRDGSFRIAALPVGTYAVRLSLIGYRPVLIQDVRIRLGKTTPLGAVRLEAQAVELPQVVVSANRETIDPTSTTIGTTLESATFEDLPTARNYRSIIDLLPHANTSYFGDETNIAGSTGAENMYYIDGVNVTETLLANESTDLPYNFIKAIEVKEGGYEAEYGRALGGIVNVITHSGSDDFEAKAFGFFTNSTLAGDPRAGFGDLRLGNFSAYDVGLTFAGPVQRDRLSFFVAYNPSFERQDIEIPGFGFHTDDKTTHMFAGKLTWRANPSSEIALTAFGDPSVHHAVGPAFSGPSPAGLENPDPLRSVANSGGANVSLTGRFGFGGRFLLDAALSRHSLGLERRGDTETALNEPLFVDNLTGVWSGGFGVVQDNLASRISGSVKGTLFLGGHTVKIGVEYENNAADVRFRWTDVGRIDKIGETLFQVLFFTQDFQVKSRVASLFLQDSWRVTERLRVNPGLRWEGQSLIGSDGGVAQPISNQFQPRIGIIFEPGGPGTEKLFASYGRFYQQLPLNFTTIRHAGFDGGFLFYGVDPRLYPDSVAFSQVFAEACCPVGSQIDGLRGEHLDEFVLGYERVLGRHVKIGLRGVHRVLREAVTVAFDTLSIEFVAGNPGRAELDFLPRYDRRYTALQLTLDRFGSRFNLSGSYILSRSHGNYAGQFDSDASVANAGNNFSLQFPSQIPNSKGLLPNDRTHVFKAFGSYRLDLGFTFGAFFTWQSGTPLNDFGSLGFFGRPIFLKKRGSAGRTPAIWDLNFRVRYDLALGNAVPVASRLVLDVLHVGSPRKVVAIDQYRFLGVDVANLTGCSLERQPFACPYEELVANQGPSNPSFGQALRHQPPMIVRVGLEVEF